MSLLDVLFHLKYPEYFISVKILFVIDEENERLQLKHSWYNINFVNFIFFNKNK